MNLLNTLSILENSDPLHLGRLLVLLGAFAKREESGTIEGLTKLAKLDFLLRYPVYLEKALLKKNASLKGLNIIEHERKSVESAMVRYRYGPWDFRYRRLINVLVAKGLAYVVIRGKTIQIGLTKEGIDSAEALANQEEFQDIAQRASLLKRYFDIKGTTLMKFIYETFPEIGTLRLGEEIES